MPIKPSQPADEQPNPYLPKGPTDPNIFEKFEGINQATTRAGVADNEAWWLDGFMPLGPNRNLRTMYGVGPSIFNSGFSIVFFNFVNIGPTSYNIIFLANGAIFAVNMDTFGSSQIAPPGTIINPSQLNIGMGGYGGQYALIVANQPNGYFVWDSAVFYAPGATIGTGTVPLGISGTAIEIYAGRVWIANGPTITFSAPGSFLDFSAGSGGGNFTSTDSFLRTAFKSLKQSNGFLYLIADSSINYISSVQTSGSPPVTTFTNQNADPEVGTPWPNTVDVFNRNILFANAFGAHVSYGGAVTKISEKLDGIYNSAPNFNNLPPSSAKAIIFGKKCYILLLPIVDPVTGQIVNKLFLWKDKLWWASNQDINLQFIQFQEVDSVITAWGTDGSTVRQLFAQPSTGFTKVAQSRLFDAPGGYQFGKAASRLWGLFQYYSALATAINISIDNELGSNFKSYDVGPQLLTWTNQAGTMTWSNSFGTMTWFSFTSSVVAVLGPTAVGQVGVLTGLTIETACADMAIISTMFWDDIVQGRY